MLDDDPTGTQTVHRVPVLIDPDVPALIELLGRRARMAFLLTNSRSLPEARAAALAARLGNRIRLASRRSGRAVSLVSRSDSTLRGHFPAEVDALAVAFGEPDAPVLLMPYFGDGGRLTIGDVHYLVRDDRPVPVAETEYAHDPAFRYAESNLRDWVVARRGTAGRPIVSLPLDEVRRGGPRWVTEALLTLPPRAIAIGNAADDRDAEVLAAGTIEAERSRVIVARTAAGYVRARNGQQRRPDLGPGQLRVGRGPGLVVVGSHVVTTTRQLERLVADPPAALEVVEIPAPAAMNSRRAARVGRAAAARVGTLLDGGVTPVVVTSRQPLDPSADDPSGLRLAGRISRVLVSAIRADGHRAAWVLAKGGITSSDVATFGLGARSATVLGQLLPGVPVWRVRPRDGPPVVLVVFPGNVGGPDDLRTAVDRLSRAASGTDRPTRREPDAAAR